MRIFVLCCVFAMTNFALPAPTDPAFDAVSVRPSGSTRMVATAPGEIAYGRRLAPFVYNDQRLTCDLTLGRILEEAFGVQKLQIVGPSWVHEETFAVAAVMPPGTSKETARGMLRTMLADRFGLRVHREARKLSVYAMVQAKGGAKLVSVDDSDKAERVKVNIPGGPTSVASIFTRGRFAAAAITMDLLAANLTNRADRPVVDKTGLEGFYKVDVEWTPEGRGMDDAGFVAAVQRKLGLRLQRQEEPYEMLIIDNVNRVPTEN